MKRVGQNMAKAKFTTFTRYNVYISTNYKRIIIKLFFFWVALTRKGIIFLVLMELTTIKNLECAKDLLVQVISVALNITFNH